MVSAWDLVCGRFINIEKRRKFLTLSTFGCPTDHNKKITILKKENFYPCWEMIFAKRMQPSLHPCLLRLYVTACIELSGGALWSSSTRVMHVGDCFTLAVSVILVTRGTQSSHFIVFLEQGTVTRFERKCGNSFNHYYMLNRVRKGGIRAEFLRLRSKRREWEYAFPIKFSL